MKKFFVMLMTFLMIITLSGCGKSDETVEVEPIEEQVFRSIIVSDINGDVKVKHADSSDNIVAYEGMTLLSGDEVTVNSNSDLTLDVDSDKHLFVEENTHFVLIADGDEETAKTKIKIDKGSVLAQIENKLTDKQSFDIETATSTMSVRGTVFRVALYVTADNQIVDMVEVYNGKVWSNISNSDAEVTLEPGQCALIKEAKTEGEETVFLAPNQIDSSFWDGTSSEIKILDGVAPSEELVHEIAYAQLSSKMVESLQEVSTSGQELSITKEDLVVLEENIKKAEEKVEVIVPVYTPKKVVEVVEEPEPVITSEPEHHNDPDPNPDPQGSSISFVDKTDFNEILKLLSAKWKCINPIGGELLKNITFEDISFIPLNDPAYPYKYNIGHFKMTIEDANTHNTTEIEADGCDNSADVADCAVLDKTNNNLYELYFKDTQGNNYTFILSTSGNNSFISCYNNGSPVFSHSTLIDDSKVFVCFYNSDEMKVYSTTFLNSGSQVANPYIADPITYALPQGATDIDGFYQEDGLTIWNFTSNNVTSNMVLTFYWTYN